METFSPDNNVEHSVLNILKTKKVSSWIIGLIFFIILFYFFFFSAPINFPVDSVIRIESGMSLRSLSFSLKERHFIRSRVIFESLIIILGGEKHIVSADYSFEEKLSVWEIARRIEKGEHNTAPVSVTIPEGFDVNQIGDVFLSKLANFNKDQFLIKAKKKEGYLFPDTYFFLADADEDDALKSMNNNFEKKINSLSAEIASSGKTQKEIIIMASIIEGEAKGDVDRGIISGILWKRIKIGMPLQVDSALETYKTKGLPDNPIGNPGMKAIVVSIHPQNSPYLYYLHDKDGNIHYAKTFAEHLQNKSKYLGK